VEQPQFAHPAARLLEESGVLDGDGGLAYDALAQP
jgi:hypothetical protein